ncbi:MAG TPA: HAMP domain-containing sensor histidine kinase [Acidimicrobiia bacterium]|nr:HAMP domain-containing sensor histidine kinase [Acidimicrobiia bacterium]
MRRRLGLVAVAVASLIVVAFSVPLGVMVRELAKDRALSGAERDAQLIAVFIDANSSDPDSIRRIAGGGVINGNALSVIFSNGVAIGSEMLAGEDLEPVFAGTAGRAAVEGGQVVYVPVIDAEGSVTVVRIFVTNAKLTEGVGRSWAILAILGTLIVAIAALIAYSLARNIVAPVEELSQAAGRLGAGELSTRVEPSGPPEIQEVGAEFNRLAEQVSQLLEAERETAADMSHRLRTPLAGLGLDIERMPESPHRERLLDDFAELQRAVDHIIREVRRPGRNDQRAFIDLGVLVRDRMSFWNVLAEEEGRETSLEIPAVGPMVSAPEADVEAAIDALIGNVLAHTKEGTGYSVVCGTEGNKAVITVDDAGFGFDPATVERGKSGAGSTGLGLDIARRTADATGGSLTVGASPRGGARVSMTLGSLFEPAPKRR